MSRLLVPFLLILLVAPLLGANIPAAAAEISNDAELRISYIESKIDEDILSENNFDPPLSLTPILSPTFIINQNWDSTGASRGEHVISVRVRDEADNWGSAGIRVRVVNPPTPTIDVTRDVQRIGNYFEVTLTLRNSGGVDVADVIINPYRMNLAKERAEAIQASNPSRGGISDPWHYTYVADLHTAEMERSAAIKRAAATGKDLILFCGHGDPGGWCAALTDWIGSGSEIEPIDFGGTNPIVAAFSCDTGNYRQPPQTDARGTVLSP